VWLIFCRLCFGGNWEHDLYQAVKSFCCPNVASFVLFWVPAPYSKGLLFRKSTVLILVTVLGFELQLGFRVRVSGNSRLSE